MPNIGVPGLIIILIIALIVFGPSKLPQLGRAVGQTLKEFKKSTKDIVDDVAEEFKLEDNDTNAKRKHNKKTEHIFCSVFLFLITIFHGSLQWMRERFSKVVSLK